MPSKYAITSKMRYDEEMRHSEPGSAISDCLSVAMVCLINYMKFSKFIQTSDVRLTAIAFETNKLWG